MIKRPMKAPGEPITDKQLEYVTYPIVGSPKVDGIRAICSGEQVLSSQLKLIGNRYIQRCLSKSWYAGLDGELCVGSPFIEHEEDDVFNRTSGPVRKHDGKPNFKLYCFDDFTDKSKDYQYRWIDQLIDTPHLHELDHIVVLEQKILTCPQDVLDYEAECVNKGYEGCMIRSLTAPYKEGRATYKEGFIWKRKPIVDDEAIIVGYYEQMENQNEKVTNELGTSSRSSHKENKVPKDTLGGFILASPQWEVTFRCGTLIGCIKEERKKMWDEVETWLGKVVKYKYQKIGSLEKPRQPRIKGVRCTTDMEPEQVRILQELYKRYC